MIREDSIMPDVRLLAAVAAGGVLGALARFGLQQAFPHEATGFGWATFAINVAGCLLIGIVVAAATESRRAPRLTRPFLVTGVLGGFTTFSTYANEIRGLLRPGSIPVAFAYLAVTLVGALLAVLVGMIATRRLVLGGRA